MRERGWGRIVRPNVAAPRRSEPRALELRLAVVGWSKTLAAEVAADGVTVNVVVVPGRIATGRVRALDEARAKREGTTVEAAGPRRSRRSRRGAGDPGSTRPRSRPGSRRRISPALRCASTVGRSAPSRRAMSVVVAANRAEEIRKRYLAVDSSNVADVLDDLGLPIRASYPGFARIRRPRAARRLGVRSAGK